MKFSSDVYAVDTYDLVVCGGGASGICAAVTASRLGLSVALIERSGTLGGTMTGGGVCHLLGGRRWDNEKHKMIREVGGLFDEITDELIRRGKAIDPDNINVDYNPHGWYPRMGAGVPCDIEALKLYLDELILKENINLFFFTTVIGTDVADKKIVRIFASDQRGIRAFEAKSFVDATGDAQIAYLSSAPTLKGRDGDHLMTPATLIAHIDNVDIDEYVSYQNEHQSPKLVEIINDLKEKGIWKFPFEILLSIALNDKDVCMLNTERLIKVDGTDPGSLSASMVEGRKENAELIELLRKYFPGFRNARLRWTAERVGIRESRRIDGRAYVTLEDAENGREYDDAVIRTTYNFDLPDPLRPSFDPMLGSVNHPDTRRRHTSIYAPYGVMLPKNIDNIIVSGRCISVCREVLGPMRVTGPVMMAGQAAGIACAIAKEENTDLSLLDGRKVTLKLRAMGLKI